MNSPATRAARLVVAALLACMTLPALAIDTERADVREFIDNMAQEHAYDRATLVRMLEEAETRPSILESISRPAERTLTWGDYRKIFITDERISAGADFWHEHAATLARISDETGVSIDILVGIIGVETYFGRITGNHRVLDALSTLAFDYPPRSRFFRRELEQFLLLVREEGMDATAATGSYAGAMGAPQFMPSSYRAYAVDASSDGKRDIWGNWADVIGSVANYFVAHGWQPGNEVAAPATLAADWSGTAPENGLKTNASVAQLGEQGVLFETSLDAAAPAALLRYDGADGDEHWVGFHNFFVITRYNHSVMYALAVHQLGQAIAREVRESNE